MADTIKLIINLKEFNIALVELKRGTKTIGNESLTISQDFDTLLIRTIDKLLLSNRIDGLSLKSLEIQGKLRSGSVSSMILKTISSALRV